MCFTCVHLLSSCICQVLGNQIAVFTCTFLLTDTPWWQILSAACVCVWKKEKKTKRRGGWRRSWVLWKIGYTHQRAGSHLFWLHVNMDASVVLWTKACHCYHPPHFATVQGSWFYVAYALFLCNEAVRASERHCQTVSMVTRAHPSWLHQPYLLRFHGTLQRLGRRRASSVCLFPKHGGLVDGAERENGVPSATLIVVYYLPSF